ncbi:MAG: hypothetical protein Q8O64_00905 [Sideroxyarcus sp.]|nr:hypothetical protein [Sideroxyarcus sp.]
MSDLGAKSENRWWEFYFVRYATGTVVGVLYLLKSATLQALNYWLYMRAGMILNLWKKKLDSPFIAVKLNLRWWIQ